MAKHDELRAYLVAALPELTRNPDKLDIYMTGGRVVARHGPNLGFEYRAQLQVDVLGFAGGPAGFFLPLILWLRKYEPAALQNHDVAEQNIRFEIDLLDGGAVDITMQLPMSEAVDVLPQPDGSFLMSLREEPPIVDEEPLSDPAALLKRIFGPGGDLIVGTPLPVPAP